MGIGTVLKSMPSVIRIFRGRGITIRLQIWIRYVYSLATFRLLDNARGSRDIVWDWFTLEDFNIYLKRRAAD